MERRVERCRYTHRREYGKRYSCYRPAWTETGRCIWHADVDDKPEAEIRRALTEDDGPLDGAILSGVSFDEPVSFADRALAHGNFSESDLSDATFTGASMEEGAFDGAVLDGANLRSSNLAGATVQDANLKDVDLTDATLRGVDFSESDLRRADLSDAYLRIADFTDAEMHRCHLSNAYLDEATFENAELSRSSLAKAQLENSVLTGANLSGADLTQAQLIGVEASDAILSRADLTGATLLDGDFQNATFVGATLVEADLQGGDLEQTILRGATVTDACLDEADLTRADASTADFRKSSLERAIFARAILFGARFEGAAIYGAVFSEARIDERTDFGQACAYDPASDYEYESTANNLTDLSLAASVYRELEVLARANAMPELVSSYFVKRQNLQRKRHYRQGRYGRWVRAWASNLVVQYGESPWRVVGTACAIIGLSALAYPIKGLRYLGDVTVVDYGGASDVTSVLLDSLYFSTLTFTTLGFGNFEPLGWGRLLATLETAMGVILFALLVFVFGRRATR